MLGDFLEFSVHSKDVLASVQYYERLGFTQIRGNDTWQHAYGIVTDGRCFLGIHSFRFPAPSLTFVAPGLRKRVDELEAAGAVFEFLKLGEDEFNELGFFLPDEQMVTLLEARTFSPPGPATLRESLLGYFAEYRLPVEDRDAACEAWLRMGLLENEAADSFHDTASLCCTGLNIGLSESRRLRRPTLVFHADQLAERLTVLEQRGLIPERIVTADSGEPRGAYLASPEGTALLMLDPQA